MVPLKTILPPEILTAPFQFGGLSDIASVWVLVQALSEHEAKLFTQILFPSTFKVSAPFCTAEANSWMVSFKLKDGVDVMAIPRAFLSTKGPVIIYRLGGSEYLGGDHMVF